MTTEQQTETYRLGRIQTQMAGSYPRPIIRVSDGQVIDYVDEVRGPAIVGDMTWDQLVARYGEPKLPWEA